MLVEYSGLMCGLVYGQRWLKAGHYAVLQNDAFSVCCCLSNYRLLLQWPKDYNSGGLKKLIHKIMKSQQ